MKQEDIQQLEISAGDRNTDHVYRHIYVSALQFRVDTPEKEVLVLQEKLILEDEGNKRMQ